MISRAFAYFNSIKVQLKLVADELPAGALEFQFHKGTIKTFASAALRAIIAYFNSIKVQLKRVYCLDAVSRYDISIP